MPHDGPTIQMGTWLLLHLAQTLMLQLFAAGINFDEYYVGLTTE